MTITRVYKMQLTTNPKKSYNILNVTTFAVFSVIRGRWFAPRHVLPVSRYESLSGFAILIATEI